MENTSILLVEDDMEDAVLTLRALMRNNVGDKVFVVRDGMDALDYVFCTNKHSDRDPRDLPQLVLLDINLPTINGLEVLRRMRADERTRHMPIVMLSSSNEPQHVEESYENGANFYMHKTINFTHFIEKMRQLSSYWLVLNTAPTRKG
jgi:two-component system response regulator